MFALLTILFAAGSPQAPATATEALRIGLLVPDVATAEDSPFVRGARRAEALLNQQGGIDGAAIELVLAAAASPAQLAVAIAELQAANVAAVVAPPEPSLVPVVQRAAGKLPCVAHVATVPAVAKALDDVCNHTFCMQYIGLVRDGSREARALHKLLAKDGLSAPAELVWDVDIGVSGKTFAKQMEKQRPHLLLVDAEPEAAAQFLTAVLGTDPIPVVLTARAVGPAVRLLPRTLFAILGLSAASFPTVTPFRKDYEFEYGVMGYGAAEGYEGVLAVAHAVDAADARDAAAVKKALPKVEVEGARGPSGWDRSLDGLAMPCAVWLLEKGEVRHYAPAVVPLKPVVAAPGTSATAAAPGPGDGPQTQIGVPFGTWRTRQFVFEEGAQWVLCEWSDDPGFATSGEDLQLLGLSTKGADAITDHLVREEIMARVLAIVSTKYRRREDGTGVPGESLRISFAAHVDKKEREKKKQRLWPARFGGDHSGAGGEAFGTYCRVYTAFIRRTIFAAHALVPPLEPADRTYLDGSYAFGTDLARDKRSELIRALINGYAGSMALTLAHEVGHLAGLGHVTDDPVEIMNVDEGGGIDYRDAHFGPDTWAIMERRYGLTEEPGRKVPRPIGR
jgi:ABC-type branched-subunit amino acid transport system substrate-binding protein